MTTYLIAHCKRPTGQRTPGTTGCNPAQLRVNARSEDQALGWFLDKYPDRLVTAIGIKGSEDEGHYVTTP